jgi:hypothetical protein
MKSSEWQYQKENAKWDRRMGEVSLFAITGKATSHVISVFPSFLSQDYPIGQKSLLYIAGLEYFLNDLSSLNDQPFTCLIRT